MIKILNVANYNQNLLLFFIYSEYSYNYNFFIIYNTVLQNYIITAFSKGI